METCEFLHSEGIWVGYSIGLLGLISSLLYKISSLHLGVNAEDVGGCYTFKHNHTVLISVISIGGRGLLCIFLAGIRHILIVEQSSKSQTSPCFYAGRSGVRTFALYLADPA